MLSATTFAERLRRWWFPAAVFGTITPPLVWLAFEYDHQLASFFFVDGRAWALVVHVTILFWPLAIPFLTEPFRRRLARFVWLVAIFISLVGNILGADARVTARTAIGVLNGEAILNGVGTTARLTAWIMGAMVPLLELAAGTVVEGVMVRLFGLHSPTDGMDALPVSVASPADAPQVAVSAVPDKPRLSGQSSPVLPSPARSGDRSMDKPRSTLRGRSLSAASPVSVGQGDKAASVHVSLGQPDSGTDKPVPARRGGGVVIPPDGITDDHLRALDLYLAGGTVRAAAEKATAQGLEGFGKSRISRLITEARSMAPDWVDAYLGRTS